MIEIKLLKNKRCRIKNEEALIIQGEQNATNVIVEFPDETIVLSKRVDFVSSSGRKFSQGLYTPEIKEYGEDFNKLKFEFNVPNDVVSVGELKMQFAAFNPEDDRVVLLYEIIILWVSEGIIRLRKSENMDLLTEMAEYCRNAHESIDESWRAANEAISASNIANEKSDEAVRISNDAYDKSVQSDNQSLEAISLAANAVSVSTSANATAVEAFAASVKAVEKADSAIETANRADEQSLQAITTAETAEANSVSAEGKADAAVTASEQAVNTSNRAFETADAANTQSLEAVATANNAESISQSSDNKSDEALSMANTALTNSETAIQTAETAEAQSLDAVETAQRADANSQSAESKANVAVANSVDAVTKADYAVETSNQANSQSQDAVGIAEGARDTAQAADNKSNEALSTANEALAKSSSAVLTANQADIQSLEATEAAARAEQHSLAAESKSDTALSNSVDAVNASNTANIIAQAAKDTSTEALAVINEANATARAANDKSDAAIASYAETKGVSIAAKSIAEQAKSISLDAINNANQALNLSNTASALSKTADAKAEIAIIDAATALSKSGQALHYSEQAMAELSEAKLNTTQARIAADEARTLAIEAKITADSVVYTANSALSRAGDAEVVATDAKISAGTARIAADLAAQAAEEAKQSALNSEEYARGLDGQIQAANDTANNAEYIAQNAMDKADEAMAKAEDAETLVASKQDALGYVPVDEASRNQPNGFAGLDNNGKIPMELINDGMLGNVQYQDLWDASTNTPNLDEVSPKGHYYIVTASGVRYGQDYNVGDWIISNGIAWGKVDNTDAVASVAGRTGNVILTKSDVGLSNVDNTSDANKPISTAAQTALNNKVDKVSGKQLSTEDYTSAEKTKLAGIATNANNYTHPASHPPSIITQDASNRFVTDTEKAAWNAKAETTQATTTTDGLMSAADKVKLNGIAAGAAVSGVKGDGESAYRTGNVNLTKANLSLGNVDNTSDANKPVSTATQTALNNKVDKVSGKQLSTEDFTSAEKTKLAGIAAGAQVNTVTSVAGKTGAVTLAKGDVGLGNVDNTTDANKPISTATQTALNNKVDKVTGKQLSTEDYTTAEKTKLAGIENYANNYAHPSAHPPSIITQDSNNRFVTDTEKAAWNAKAEKTTATTSANGLMSAADKTKLDGLPTVDNKSTQLVSNTYEVKGYSAAAVSTIPMKNAAANGFDWLKINAANGIPILNASGYLTQLALNARADENGNTISSFYLPKNNGVATGYLGIVDTNSKLSRGTTSPAGNNIGVTGVMLTHYSSDEGGIMINEDGAYLWNSTDSGSLFRGLDEDVWTSATTKYNATFSTGLMFDFDSSGNLKLKGNIFVGNGGTQLYNTTSLPASSITVTANSNLGGYTNLQDVLNYIANVFAGTQQVTKIKAANFDTP